MASQFQIDNNGIGGTPFLTFTVDTSANKDFTQTDLDNNLSACVISADNEVGMGSAGDKLFGKVVWVSQELQAGTTVRRSARCRLVAWRASSTPLPRRSSIRWSKPTERVR